MKKFLRNLQKKLRINHQDVARKNYAKEIKLLRAENERIKKAKINAFATVFLSILTCNTFYIVLKQTIEFIESLII